MLSTISNHVCVHIRARQPRVCVKSIFRLDNVWHKSQLQHGVRTFCNFTIVRGVGIAHARTELVPLIKTTQATTQEVRRNQFRWKPNWYIRWQHHLLSESLDRLRPYRIALHDQTRSALAMVVNCFMALLSSIVLRWKYSIIAAVKVTKLRL